MHLKTFYKFSPLVLIIGIALICIPKTHTEKSVSFSMNEQKISPSVKFTPINNSGKNIVTEGWMERVQNNIISRSTDFQKLGDGHFTAYNALNNLRAYISPAEMNLKGYAADNYNWNATLQLSAVSTNAGIIETGDLINMIQKDNELTYNYENIGVQYINTKEGIRQNFIINEAPETANALSVNLKIDSKLNPHVVKNTLILSHNNIQLLKYSDLQVFDKNGKTLPAKMVLNGDMLAMEVDIRNAEFPVTVDPISTSYAWKVTGGQEFANMGFWICGRGDLNGDGYADVALGVTNYTHILQSEGAVFVYYGSPSGLNLTPDWVAYGEQDSCLFGRSISIEGDVNGDGYDDMMVGAAQIRNPFKDEGKVYLYLGGPSGLTSSPVWQFEGNRKHAKLGDVSIIGDVNGDGFDDVAVGAHGWDNTEDLGDLGDKAGKFWVFLGTNSGTGLQTTAWMSCVGQDEDANLGVSLDAAGDVNGDGYDDFHIGGYIFLIGDGMICTFNGGPDGPDNIPDFMAIGGAHDTSFYAVNLSEGGDINGDGYSDVLIGMPRFDTYGVYNAGKLRYHFGGPGGFDTTKYDLLGEGQLDERFAFNVNDAGDLNKDGYDDILLTSKHYSPTGLWNDSVGRGYLYLGGPDGPQQKPTWTFDGEVPSGVGTNIASAGDINGDGLIDILLTSDGYSGSYAQEGVAYMFYGIEQVCDPPTGFTSIGVGTSSATFSWDWVYGSYMYKVYIKKIGYPGPPIVVSTTDNSITVTGLTPGATYKCYVKTKCQAGWTGRSSFKTIHTLMSPGKSEEGSFSDINIYPNPVSDALNISTGNAGSITAINIFDAKGDLVIQKTYTNEMSQQVLQIKETENLAGGIYFVQISNGEESIVKKFTKSK